MSAPTDDSDQSTHRVSTGIPDLDPLLQGGLRPGKSYLITGGPGVGKSIFCIQFILSGLTDGEKAVYVAVDDKPDDIVEEANSLGWDLLRYVEGRQLLILDASPFFSTRMGLGRGRDIDVSKTVGDLASYVKRIGASRVVIDPAGPLISSWDSTHSMRDNARSLLRTLQDNMETTNMLTSYSLSGSSMGGQEAEDFPVTGVVVLRFVRKENGLIRTLLISKMRGTTTDLIEYRFDIVRGKGVVLEPMLPERTTPLATSGDGIKLFKEWKKH